MAVTVETAAASTSSTDIHENTLLKFRFNHAFRAERGRHGEGSTRHGRNGEDLEIKIPIGTVVVDDQTGEVLHDFTKADERRADR